MPNRQEGGKDMKNTSSTTTRPVHQFWNVLQFPLTRIILASVFVGIGGAGTQVLIALLRRTNALDSPLPIPFVLFEIIIAVLAAYGVYSASVHLIEHHPVHEVCRGGGNRQVAKPEPTCYSSVERER
jgi:hypothetical protein